MELLALFLSAALINNVILTQFLGVDTVLVGPRHKLKSVAVVGMAVIIILLLSTVVTYPLLKEVLPIIGLEFFSIVVIVFVVFGLVVAFSLFLKKFPNPLYDELQTYLPLLVVNSAIIGVGLLVSTTVDTYLEALVYALGAGFGYLFISIVFASIRNRLEIAKIPNPLKGLPIALITASLMAIALLGLAGLF